ncbi:hypothetical protein [Oryzibacter oryziterrae]|uniref:hypothetical protein n=1 Tax=Oryzibacter oryziterrae TaxID=2766474 RepID=UPI001F3934EA|nr:hypothetical protein [Oryzibacter oryziterrae]
MNAVKGKPATLNKFFRVLPAAWNASWPPGRRTSRPNLRKIGNAYRKYLLEKSCDDAPAADGMKQLLKMTEENGFYGFRCLNSEGKRQEQPRACLQGAGLKSFKPR